MELGKVLASKVRTKINEARNNNRFMANSDGFNYSTTRMINKYLSGKKQVCGGGRPGRGVGGREEARVAAAPSCPEPPRVAAAAPARARARSCSTRRRATRSREPRAERD